MKFILNKDKLTVENEECANSGSVQYYEVDVEHDDSWNDLSIEAVIVPKEGGTLIFDDAESIAEIDNKIYIDRELSGSYAIGFKGFTIENEVKVYQISTNLQGVYFEVGAGQIITTNSIPKPTEWEIYVAQIEAIANRASQSADDAQTSADNAETSADNAQTSAETATEQAETATEQAEEATRQAESAKDDADRAGQAREGFETEVENATRDFNTNATNKTNSFDENADTKTTEYNTNHTNKLKDYNDNATEKFGAYNTNHTNKLKTYNDNHTEKLGDYNTNATNKTKDYNDNTTEKTNTFNTNATNKTDTFNDNATNKTTTFNDNATSKTTDFNDNAEDKTTEFNEVVDTAKDDIEEIAPMLQDKIAKIPSMMQDKTATGTSIHTTDSALWYGKLNFDGFSRQETTTGKNKFSGWTKGKTINPNNGGQSNSETGAVSDYLEVNFNTTDNYTISGLVDTLFSFVAAYNSNKEFLGRNGALDRNTRTISSSSFTSGTPQGTGDIAYIRVTQYESGSTTGTIELIDNAKTQFEIGSEATDYEPYTGGIPQPNIEFPSEIRNLTGDVGIKRVGKNLFNQDEVSFASGILDDNGNPVSSSTSHYTQNFYKVIPNNTYSLSGTLQKSSSNDAYRIYFYDGSKNWISRTNTITSPTYTFGIPENCHYIRIQVLASLTLKTDDVQLENGLVTDYEAYKEKTITFPLGTEKMYQGSTLTDNGIKHIRKKIVFDGTENWSMYSDTPGKYYCTTKHFGRETGYENPSTFKCTHFTPAIGTVATNGISSTKFATYINMDTTTISDLSSFKTWLSNNNVLVEYLSAEPETVPYTQTQQDAYDELQNLETYQYVNNIELAANEETNMTFEYKEDIQMQIKEETSKLTQAIVALGGVVE